jgi:hypothetical protein
LADFAGRGWLDILCQNYDQVDGKNNQVESWVLLNDHGSFSLDRKRTFHTYGALSGTLAQIWRDGKPAFVNANYLDNKSRRVPTYLLHSDADGYPTDAGKVALPAFSSAGNYVMDFTGSGYQDILVFNHTAQVEFNGELEPKGGTHGIDSFLYRGGPNGYQSSNRTLIPSFGPHFRTAAEPGSISRRDSFEVYTSKALVNSTAGDEFILTIGGRFNRRQFVDPKILVDTPQGGGATTRAPVLVSRSDTSAVFRVSIPTGATFRYQLKLDGSFSGGGPVVSSVRVVAID